MGGRRGNGAWKEARGREGGREGGRRARLDHCARALGKNSGSTELTTIARSSATVASTLKGAKASQKKDLARSSPPPPHHAAPRPARAGMEGVQEQQRCLMRRGSRGRRGRGVQRRPPARVRAQRRRQGARPHAPYDRRMYIVTRMAIRK